MLTVVVSGVAAFAAAVAPAPVVITRGFEETVAGTDITAGCVDDAAPLEVPLESLGAALRGAGLGGGKSSWETAMTISERNKARKKRLSIQGTGS